MNQPKTLSVDGKTVALGEERNLLELVRRAGVDIPTFCYHSELSVYGACRLCLVEVEGRGVIASCALKAEPGMVVRTSTEEIRETRKVNMELLLANHIGNCMTCDKSDTCKLRSIARKLGVSEVRFQRTAEERPKDFSSPSLVRDPNKCILCGDCVRACREIQGIGAIDFVRRGQHAAVEPAFGKGLGDVDCVHCGQCARVCPTAAITVKNDTDAVWAALHDPKKKVVAQIAPAVRTAIGEMFGCHASDVATGRIVAALKHLGFDRVYDTSFTADLTVVEEAAEFVSRVQAGEKLPLFTSCCPGWVTYAEQYAPDLLKNLSSCKSPQQMLGSLLKRLPNDLGVKSEDLVVVSIMPCTAKKYEASRPEHRDGQVPDVDLVLTTLELGRMIDESGLRFAELPLESLDMPFGFKTGAGVLFGASGGVSEAVLRHLAASDGNFVFEEVRGDAPIRTTQARLGARELEITVVHGLANAKSLLQDIRNGAATPDMVEVMACPGGCVGGAGQPDCPDVERRRARAKALYEADKSLPLHRAAENPFVKGLYDKHLGEPGGHRSHALLHTRYKSRRRITNTRLPVLADRGAPLEVQVCLGTSCYVRGSQRLLQGLAGWVLDAGLTNSVNVEGHFCFEQCQSGPTVRVGDATLHRATLEQAKHSIEAELGTCVAPSEPPPALLTPITP
jgi:NADH-quinone oxidoreductase subunit G